MGYTHYWRMSRDFTALEWEQISGAASELIKASPTELAGGYRHENEPPAIDKEVIYFNAKKEDEQCEDFCLTAGCQDFEFCKTAARPYDTVVVAILAFAAKVAPSAITVSSDGDEQDWKDGLKFGAAALGIDLAYPCKREE